MVTAGGFGRVMGQGLGKLARSRGGFGQLWASWRGGFG